MKRILALIALFAIVTGAVIAAGGIFETFRGTIAPSRTYSFQTSLEDLDSIHVMLEASDTTAGRFKLWAYNTLDTGYTVVDTAMIGAVAIVGAGQARIPWWKIKAAIGGTWDAYPAYIRIDYITNGNGNATTSRNRPLKGWIRKFAHK
jgi:hypothetical protein